MAREQTVDIPLVNPLAVGGYDEAGGVRRYYVQWEMPPQITSAIGLGCSGRRYCVHGSAAPVAECVEHGDLSGVYIALRVRS